MLYYLFFDLLSLFCLVMFEGNRKNLNIYIIIVIVFL